MDWSNGLSCCSFPHFSWHQLVSWWQSIRGWGECSHSGRSIICIHVFFFFFFFKFYFIFKLYIIVLVLTNIKMNPPQVYMCSPSWTLLPPPCWVIIHQLCSCTGGYNFSYAVFLSWKPSPVPGNLPFYCGLDYVPSKKIKVLTPCICEGGLNWKQDLGRGNQIKMRSCWIRMGAPK